MGMFDFLFGTKKRHDIERDKMPVQSRSQEQILFNGDFVNIEPLGFFGSYKKSKSGGWVIAWSDWGDTDEGQHLGGHRDSGRGRYILYNDAEQKIVLQGRLQRPNSGKVANNGHFCIEDWHFGSDLSGTFYVFSPSGEELIKKEFNANIYNSAISDSGRYAICQTAHNPNDGDGNLLVAFDIKQSPILFSLHPTTFWANSYDFLEDDKQFGVAIDRIGNFRYDCQGNFIDAEKYASACLNCDRFDVMIMAVEKLLKEPALDQRKAETALAAILRARTIGADKDQRWKALALKLQGFSHEVLGNNTEALSAFDEALKIDPKIGVKRKADALRKKLPK